MSRLLSSLACPDAPPFAVVRRHGGADVDVLVGTVLDVEQLADIPRGRTVLALVPFRQVRERGFTHHDDGAPLRCLVVTERESVPVEQAVGLLPAGPVPVQDHGFDVPEEEYAETVRWVIDTEIGRGEGANFVIRRDALASTTTAPALAVLGWLRELLLSERGAYWTFAVHTPGISMAGATPERHVSVAGGEVLMNPISGTYRHPSGDLDPRDFLSFLSDTKETEELFMVVDEEMKMMSRVCADGGRITGPHLKQMAHLTHTEYHLRGRSSMDPREVLRHTMFAPTVTGSPMENACAVITRHERTPRGYYSGVLAWFDTDEDGAETLDAPILIRTAHLDGAGRIRIPVGATLVRHSVPEHEAAETVAKASGVLAALGLRPGRGRPSNLTLADQPGVADLLAARNERLSAFWLTPQQAEEDPVLLGRRAVVVDAEDAWTQMIAHQLRHFGMTVDVVRWDAAEPAALDAADLVLFGPGPGDPRSGTDPRISRLRELMVGRLEAGLPLVAVCLSHQILGALAGLEVEPLPAPRQGVQLQVDLWGREALIGFYNTFTVRTPAPVAAGSAEPQSPHDAVPATPCCTPHLGLQIAHEAGTEHVWALRGPGVSSVQGHAESVLSRDGLAVLRSMVTQALVSPVPTVAR